MTAAEHELRGTFKPSRHGGNGTSVRTNWAERLAAMRPDVEFPGFGGQTLASGFSRRGDAKVQAPGPRKSPFDVRIH